ncbi:alpha/beta hydrolase [Cupriavidus sp. USMAA2-4]|uniref:Alpha/beta hydrolase n=1 Tax=Cupriavidus malaysiensis TaxID=367825 RepID=A0ABN4TTZ5_9BURK|nr:MULTISPECIES: alpha/beta hydrolase [Cupriavidus]AOY95144.1 alpha/beta hydrolase [Cupriavidus sp. USMAA2-4]AOZ01959.1 alpha/beta hydrolase [Cupriavidus sp. USMAHM13]AOZ08305.1 alpha/beta hydrolase [Cupriavidus malaysiensis]
MKHIVFEGCTGWLHGAAGDTGVVLCAPPGHEGMWSHRALRHLADDLAAAGVPVLRFDYHGTGDAAGSDEAPERLACWIGNIVAAAAQLRARAGVRQVVLCGLRLGGSLAALAAEALAGRNEAPAALVLLAPVVSGRAFLREMRALHVNWLNSMAPDLASRAPREGTLEVLAYRLGADTVRALEGLRLDRRAGCPAPRVLVLDPWPGAASTVQALCAHYRAAGAEVEEEGFAEYAALMQSTENAAVPEQAWRRVAAWIRQAAATAAEAAAGQAIADAPGPDRADDTEFAVEGVRERAVWLDAGRQFGILCMPAGARRAPLGVIFPNTGGNHHVGDGRLFVSLSRRLARSGVAALRLDLAALGDSPQARRRMSIPEIYAVAPREQLAAAVEWMHGQGFEHIVLAGVCSGAFLSLHAGLASDKVCGLVLANLLKYTWGEQDVATLGQAEQPLSLLWYAARRPGNWLRLLRGDIRLLPLLMGCARRVRALVAYRLERVQAALRGGASRKAAGEDDGEARTAREFAWAAVRKLDRRGVRTEFLYGATDIGLEETAQCLGRNLEALQGLSHVAVQRLDCLDHALFLRESQDNFGDHVVRHVEALLARQADPGRPAEGTATPPLAARAQS